MYGRRLPPRAFCRECGADLGRSWAKAPICAECAPNSAPSEECICVLEHIGEDGKRVDFEWNPLCEEHTHDPYDIPF